MKRNHGFTLVEILIVVIILGILAAIVIPQFTNASNDARTSSVSSTLQTIRSQIELYKIQHKDVSPAPATMGAWELMLSKTDADGVATTATTGFGPYLQQQPVNPLNGKTAISTDSGAVTTAGWYYTVNASGAYTIQARDTDGTVKTIY